MIRLRASWEYLRGTYWAVPSAMALAAVLLSFGMIQLDEAVTATLLDRPAWVYTGGPEGARAVLSTIAGSMITVAGVTFSITIVALTDVDHTLRVITCPVRFATLVDSAFAEIGRYGASSVSVTCRLLDAVRTISSCVRCGRDGEALLEQAAVIVSGSRQMTMATRDREVVEKRYDAVRAALAS